MSTSLTIRQVAKRVGRTEETVRRWIWSGRLPATKRGNLLYVDEGDIPATTESGRSAPAQSVAAVSLADWGKRVEAWRATTPIGTGTAADLVIEDRHSR